MIPGVVAAGCWAVHAAVHVRRGTAAEMWWGCHLGALIIGAGMIAGAPLAVAVGVCWLCFGNVLWAVDLARGGEFMPTAMLTHWGGLAIGLYGVRTLGVPRGTWAVAAAAHALLVAFSRVATRPELNVNLAHRVWPGFERAFPSHRVYLVAVWASGTAVYAVTQAALSMSGFAPAR